jgi:hypothetical protein
MGFAPLDVWFRLLFRPPATIPPRFWPRLVFALFLSLLVTIITLPERALAALYLRLWGRHKPLPGPVIVLGYYRSGTTLLQYLLSCDPNVYSPNWAQVFAPQGWWLTWTLLRWFVLPFFPRTRPQDNVAFGPLVPAEDDFALNNGALASPLVGRIVVPHCHQFYDRFHDLKGLTLAERRRWRSCQEAFVRKLAPLAGGRRILLKTPAHTARIPALLDLFKDTTGARFIYISRHPHKVFRSNVAMLRQLPEVCGLQPPLADEELEAYLLAEYVATEETYQRTRGLIPAGRLAEVRLQDLQADPLGTMRRVYDQLGLPFTPAFERGMIAYLSANRDYQPNVHAPWTPKQKETVVAALQPLVKQGRHDDPPPASVPLPAQAPDLRRRQVLEGLSLGLVTAALAGAVLVLLASWLGVHSLGFAWPCGVAIGVGVLRGASDRGSAALGAFALGLTGLTLAAVTCFSPGLLVAVREWLPLSAIFGPFWWGLALASAYRIGSQHF